MIFSPLLWYGFFVDFNYYIIKVEENQLLHYQKDADENRYFTVF